MPMNVPQIADIYSAVTPVDVGSDIRLTEPLLRGVIDRHAPVKKRVIKHSQLPYMNDELRRAMNVTC